MPFGRRRGGGQVRDGGERHRPDLPAGERGRAGAAADAPGEQVEALQDSFCSSGTGPAEPAAQAARRVISDSAARGGSARAKKNLPPNTGYRPRAGVDGGVQARAVEAAAGREHLAARPRRGLRTGKVRDVTWRTVLAHAAPTFIPSLGRVWHDALPASCRMHAGRASI